MHECSVFLYLKQTLHVETILVVTIDFKFVFVCFFLACPCDLKSSRFLLEPFLLCCMTRSLCFVLSCVVFL